MSAIARLAMILLVGMALSSSSYAGDGPLPGQVLRGSLTTGQSGENNRQDMSPAACDGELGCFTRTGALCKDNPNDRCDIAVVPQGRCTAGSGDCIWPQGAGVCETTDPAFEEKVHCLTDDYIEYLQASEAWVRRNEGIASPGEPTPPRPNETARGESSACTDVPGGNGFCDMSANESRCDCTGFDNTRDISPTNPSDDVLSWEGVVCGPGNLQAVCSDADPKSQVAGYGLHLCTQICVDATCSGADGNCGNDHTQDGALTGNKYANGENPTDVATLQRAPGSGFSTPASGPIVPNLGSNMTTLDEVGEGDFAAFGIRRIRSITNSSWNDAFFSSVTVNGVIDNTGPQAYICDIPRGAGWAAGQPIDGRCRQQPGKFCIADDECPTLPNFPNDVCNGTTFEYCHQGDFDPGTVDPRHFDATGFLYTRALTPSEIAAAGDQCPPDCRISYDYDTFEEEAIIAASFDSGDPRIGQQLTMDELEGPRAQAGQVLFSAPLVAASALLLGDLRCYIGGDPDRPDPLDIGRCRTSATGCNPRVAPALNGCPVAEACLTCGGVLDEANKPFEESAASQDYARLDGNYGFDPINGNPEALPPGYPDPHPIAAMNIRGRIDRVANIPATLETPLTLVLVSGASTSAFKDNTCEGGTTDKCDLGEVNGGSRGIGAGKTYTAGTTIPNDPTFTFNETWVVNPSNPGDRAGNVFVPITEWGVGPDGIPGCMGDNDPANPNTPCDERLGDDSDPGSTGIDDRLIRYDFSEAQDGSVMKTGSRTIFPFVQEPFAISPVFSTTSTLALRDLPSVGNTNGIDVTGKLDLTFCPIVSREGLSGRYKSACIDKDTDQDGWLDEQDGCPLNPAIGVIHPDTNPDTGGVENPNSDPGGFLPDGVADACQCGDVNNDGRVTGNDSTFIKRACLGLAPFQNTVVNTVGCAQSQPGPPANAQPFNRDKCDVGSGGGGPGGCSGNDSTVVRRSTLGLVLPGIKNTCTAYGQPPAP